ncbi:hypothetical protein H4R34_002930 [Dimargaris verticillata]|uniref:Uncharacterized protein n=1 Tax=Dimargaris verticillata TaxID=2761393 RepID=A0A9W8B8I1_9FUNG|nr:hypothetical protein H4R34_002930 [Dimargaris verticillata]
MADWRGRRALGKDPEQVILNVIRLACAPTIADPDFGIKLRAIKHAFAERDFDRVFQTTENLPIYTAQYIPGRVLCYYQLITREPAIMAILRQRPSIFCMGGGAGSELMALAAASLNLPTKKMPNSSSSNCAAETSTIPPSPPNPLRPIICHTQDYVDWRPVLASLESTARSVWKIPPEWLQTEFTMGDLLFLDQDLEQRIGNADLVTAMFVMNELFTLDKQRAMKLVHTIVKALRPGKHLLLVDSAGSFSHVQIGSNTYMVYTIFDSLRNALRPVVTHSNVWYRYPLHLRYPLKLDNMQYYVRLYQKL